MAELTYKNACIIYLEKNMECIGYRDYIIKQLNKLEQIEQVVDNYLSDNKDVYYDTEVYMDDIIDIVRD